MKPRAKHDGMLLEQLEDELIVYDRGSDRGHCLNRTAAIVWRHADGDRTIADLAAILRSDLDPMADEDLVWHALDRLSAAQLLEEPPRRPVDETRASRRRFIAKVGLMGVATLLLPVVTSVASPSSAQAAVCSCGCGGGFSPLLAEWFARR